MSSREESERCMHTHTHAENVNGYIYYIVDVGYQYLSSDSEWEQRIQNDVLQKMERGFYASYIEASKAVGGSGGGVWCGQEL